MCILQKKQFKYQFSYKIIMTEELQEMGNCEECGIEINLAEVWRVDEKFYCRNCFEKLNL